MPARPTRTLSVLADDGFYKTNQTTFLRHFVRRGLRGADERASRDAAETREGLPDFGRRWRHGFEKRERGLGARLGGVAFNCD